MSLLTVIQDAYTELGLTPIPLTVIGNRDPQVVQMLGLANQEGQEFCKLQGPWGGWPELNKTYTFNLVPAGPFTGQAINNSPVLTGFTGAQTALIAIDGSYGVAGPNVYQSATVIGKTTTTIIMSAVSSGNVTNGSYNFGQIQYALPGDIRSFVNATQWDRNFRWPMLGPLSPVEWQVIVSGISPVGPRIRFRVQDNVMTIQPLPGASQTDQIAYEYVSNAWCTSSAGVPNVASGGVCRFATDTDLYLWPEDVLRYGIKWRFRRAKGLDYSQELKTWQDARDFQLSVSGASRSLRMNAVANGLHFLNYSNCPDTGYGNVSG